MSKIAFWGDLHIGRLSKILDAENSFNYHRKLLNNLLVATRAIGAQRVAIMGDLFDHPFPSQDEMSLVLESLSVSDLKFLIFLGNHDLHTAEENSLKFLSKLPKAGALTNVVFITQPRVVKWAGLKVLVLPYGNNVPNNFKGDLILFHNSVVGAMRDNNTLVTQGNGFHPSLFKNTLAVGGHLHTPQRLGNTYFVGSQGQFSFGEGEKKKFHWLEDGKMYSQPFQPPWMLKTVSWDSDNPPNCNELDTYYRLKIGENHPGPKWVSQHPQVIKTFGGSNTKRQAAANKVVNLMERRTSIESDEELLLRWLTQYSNLSKLARMQAIRIHSRLSSGE